MATATVIDDAVIGCSLEVLEAEICRWAANLTVAEARWLALLVEFDRRRGWEVAGCTSCAAWLSWQTSLDLRTAHEKLRVAHVLDQFPRLAEQMATGALSYAKVRAVSRIVTDDNIDDLIGLALAATSNQVERFVTAFRRHRIGQDEQRAHQERSLIVRNDDSVSTIVIRLPAESAAVLVACVDLFLGDSDRTDNRTVRRADAVIAMASHAVAHSGESAVLDNAHLATVHLTPDALRDHGDGGVDGLCCVAPGDGLGADPVGVPRESAERILCDTVIQGVLHADDGPVTVGQGQRTVSKRMKRSLRFRDRGCRFPGCSHQVWVDAHHIIHWTKRGPTVAKNLVCLCRRHHRLFHEGGWTMTGDPNGELWFFRPNGARIAARPLPVTGHLGAVEGHGRTADDGRCNWEGDPLELAYALDVITHNEDLRHQQAHSPGTHSPGTLATANGRVR